MTNPKHTDTSRSGELKPCPFCGEQCAVLNEDIKWAGYQPSCLEVRTGYDSSPDAEWRTEAIAAWNNRPADRIEALEAEVERLREALREISETPNAGWMIARAALGEK